MLHLRNLIQFHCQGLNVDPRADQNKKNYIWVNAKLRAASVEASEETCEELFFPLQAPPRECLTKRTFLTDYPGVVQNAV